MNCVTLCLCSDWSEDSLVPIIAAMRNPVRYGFSLSWSLLAVLTTVLGQSHDSRQSWIQFADDHNVGGSFEHLTVDLRTGRLYVSATNRLYQLDERLTAEAVVTTGPQADNPLCPPPPTADCHDARRVPTDATSKALALDLIDGRVIACTNLFQVPVWLDVFYRTISILCL